MQSLVLDTSGPFTTVLVISDGKLSTLSTVQDRPAEHLHQQIASCLDDVSLRPQDLSRIAVVIGPGSWTGLNIGVTTAKTLSQVLEIPLVPIRTLDALTIHCAPRVWGIMHAGRHRCYYAVYTESSKSEMDVLPINAVIEQIDSETPPVGIIEYGETFSHHFTNHQHYQTTDRLSPEALMTAADETPALEGESVKLLTPAYLQPSHVERDASL
ncbi:MAG: tRNA (adenosine(37)-N6)-threonylcarbamoyltransferase complex dimerization subunit type 1 TsaB [Bacteroidetes bacterium]|nr:tRNA (adenosine(37)-N6)-threonylcarbamoyltransferase complex dimerization subunit type 1 TsaB [Bacteroidota bacterium]